ncbi:MAG: hypothetical protein UZ21_OP11001000745 [Microgenomates bacterium OLB22]|nr:MAG: hypothetical protein UZ21_OP11001000745 [Microgenomates bacterium OLB22]
MSSWRFPALVFALAGALVFLIYRASVNGTHSSNASDSNGIGVMVSKHSSVTEPYDFGYVTDFPSASYLYIEFGRDGGPMSQRERLAQLISMLLDWQKVNPDKLVISTSFIAGSDPYGHRTWSSGLFVTYQTR